MPGSGVDLARFQYVPAKEDSARKFLFIGRLLDEKGIQEYLAAARILVDQGHIAKFLILGNLPDDLDKKGRLLRAIQTMGAVVRYLGVVTDVRPQSLNHVVWSSRLTERVRRGQYWRHLQWRGR